MNTIFTRFLLLLAVFSIVLLFDMNVAFGTSKPSSKVRGEGTYSGTTSSSFTRRMPALASRSLSPPMGNGDVDTILSYAKGFIGIKYKYGGSGPDNFDCSGFTMHVMGKFGIELPHSARGQSKHGIVVSKEDLRPGDMIYFDTSKGEGISHVGIYAGDGNFIHASRKGVRVSSLEEGYYEKRYVMATRVIR